MQYALARLSARALALSALATLLPVAAQASVTLAATSVSTVRSMYLPLIGGFNQDGLSQTYTSGVTDFATFVAGTTHTPQPPLLPAQGTPSNIASMDVASSRTTLPVSVDLGATKTVDGLAFWNIQNALAAIAAFSVYLDNDMDTTNGVGTLLGSYNPTIPTAAPIAGQTFSWAAVDTRYLVVEFTENRGASGRSYAFGEIVFSGAASTTTTPANGVPEPGTAACALFALGLLAAARRRRA